MSSHRSHTNDLGHHHSLESIYPMHDYEHNTYNATFSDTDSIRSGISWHFENLPDTLSRFQDNNKSTHSEHNSTTSSISSHLLQHSQSVATSTRIESEFARIFASRLAPATSATSYPTYASSNGNHSLPSNTDLSSVLSPVPTYISATVSASSLPPLLAQEVSIISIHFPSFHVIPNPPLRPYHSYPSGDDWSVSSISSDSTCTTHASTISIQSISDQIHEPVPYHNPLFLGSLHYYFPPRLQPLSLEESSSSDNQSTRLVNSDTYLSHPIHPLSLSSDASVESTYSSHENRSLSSEVHTHIPAFIPPIPINIREMPSGTPSFPVLPSSATPIPIEGTDPPPSTPILHQSTLDQCWDNFQSSTNSIRANEAWGDTIDVKCAHTVRIYFQNVNSIGLSQNTMKLNTILQSMQQADCDIINLVQTSINWRFLHLRNRLRTSIQQFFPIHKLHVSRNKFNSIQPALPGGCAQIVQGNWSGRIVDYVHDPRNMGRWCGVKLRLKGDRHLYLITAYRVCKQHSASIGPETAYRQQELLLALDGIASPDPRQQFVSDLILAVRKWQSSMDEVIISFDANEQLGDSVHGLTKLMRECRLIDIFHHHHGICPSFETFDLGSKRLDYIIGSASLLPFVNRCGYLPFYQGIPSDHRGMFLDLSHALIDGITRLESTPTRYLHSSYQTDIYKYKRYVQKEFESHNIYKRATDLYNMSLASTPNDAMFVLNLETLDKQVLQIQLQAEVKCCKKRTKYDWSDDIHYTKRCLLYWSTKRKQLTRYRATESICKSIYDSLPAEHRLYIDIAINGRPSNNWRKTKDRLILLMAHHRKTRAVAQHSLFDNEATFTGTTIDKVQLKKERIKRDKKLYNTLRHHFHPSQRSGITHLLVPDKDAHGQVTTNPEHAVTWKTETQPEEVLTRLFERNITHFGQAEGTPFTTSPLVDQLGYTGMTSVGTTLIQQGKLPETLSHTQEHANNILNRLCEDSSSYHAIEELITIDKFKQTIRKWSESTSTSPSGKHLGHYKSLLAIDSQSSTYTEESPDPGSAIIEVLYNMAASAFHSGISLTRWQRVNTCMIEKIPGNPRINKLRVIHLYEADYNAFNKLIWQRGTVWEAHKSNTLNPGQSGSRPNHNCMDVLMSKGQKYLFSNLTRTPMATMDNDAKSCYDRMVATLALLVSHKFGVPQEFCQTVGETLQAMQFSIRTAMGDSVNTYSHGASTPIHGVGQGGTASPAFWLLVSSIMFDCYQRRATGMTMSDPTHTITVQQWLEALVDDTSLFTNLPNDPDINNLVRTLEKDAQDWERFLSASGGCLELSKCFYYVLSWTFNKKGDAVPMTLAEINSLTMPIHLQEYDKLTPTPISSKAPQDAHKTLGVWKSMDGNVKEQIKALAQRSKNLSNIVATSGLYPYQAEVALRMIYTPAMCYSLPAVSIPEKELNKIQNKAMGLFTPATGYNPGFPLAVVYGPVEYGGSGVPHLYTEMNLEKLEYIIMHIRSNSDLGKLFRINLNWIQINIGIAEPFLEYPHEITYLTNWFTHLHHFLRHINARVSIKDTYVPIMEREGDCCIMNTILQCSVKLSKNQLRHVHNWRLFFQVAKLSDITNESGDCIRPEYLKYPTGPVITTRRSKLQWPCQGLPECQLSFKCWVKCIRTCFLQGRGTTLTRPLGKWIVNPLQSESIWEYYIHHDYKSLIKYKSDQIVRYDIILRSTSCTTTFDTSVSVDLQVMPSHFIPVMTNSTLPFNCIASHNKQRIILSMPVQCLKHNDLTASIKLQMPWKQHILQHFYIHNQDEFLSDLLNKNQSLMAVSDGGLRDGIGSFGVAIGTNINDLGTIEGPAPGNAILLTSLRSEAYGLLAALAFLNLYVRTYNIIIPANRILQLCSDNLGLVKWVEEILNIMLVILVCTYERRLTFLFKLSTRYYYYRISILNYKLPT